MQLEEMCKAKDTIAKAFTKKTPRSRSLVGSDQTIGQYYKNYYENPKEYNLWRYPPKDVRMPPPRPINKNISTLTCWKFYAAETKHTITTCDQETTTDGIKWVE
jgi:hypothetical protein